MRLCVMNNTRRDSAPLLFLPPLLRLQSMLQQRITQARESMTVAANRGITSALTSLLGPQAAKSLHLPDTLPPIPLSFRKWRTGKSATRWADGAVAGMMPSPLFHTQVARRCDAEMVCCLCG